MANPQDPVGESFMLVTSELPITSIEIFESEKDYELWDRQVDAWTYNHDLDKPAPEANAVGHRTRSRLGVEVMTGTLEEWKRSQKKAVALLRNRVSELAYQFTESDETVAELRKTMKKNFQLKGDAEFLVVLTAWNELHLDKASDIGKYNLDFQSTKIKLDKFMPDKTEMPRPLVISRYTSGLGPAFHSWLITFWLNNSIIDVAASGSQPERKGVELRHVMREAAGQALRMQQQDAESLQAVALAAFKKQQANPQSNNNGSGSRRGNNSSRVTKRPRDNQRSDTNNKWCEHPRHGWGKHTSEDCITLHPEKESEWRAANPALAASRDENRKKHHAAPSSGEDNKSHHAKLAISTQLPAENEI